MLRKAILSAFIVSSVAISAHAQGVCGTDNVYQKLKGEHPEIAVYEQQLEAAIKQGIRDDGFSRFARTTANNDTVVYDIPIVIHIVHDYGTEYVSDNAIFEAVKVWQDVYMKRNSDTADVIPPFKKYIGNARIRLHLATIDPNGNPTKGIVRHHSYWAYNAGDEAKLEQWPQNSYLNIWFVNQFSGEHAGAAAYAYYPSMAASLSYYDGVISLADYINYDKAIPHEIGHCLNLEHVWGNTNNPDVACGDDDVDDTPPTKGHLPAGCSNLADMYDVSCSAGYKKTYTDIHGVDSIVDYPDTANAQNIMDYTYCQKMFTIGQAERMRISLANTLAGRNNLFTPQNLTKTGALNAMPDLPPVADFSVEKGIGPVGYTSDKYFFGCINNNVSMIFKNQSWNDTITRVNWTFSNGAAASTSTGLVNVFNRFTQPGWVTVSLTATSNAGSNTITKQAVYVADDNATNAAGYVQDFQDATAMANWPVFNYFDNQFKWEPYSGAGYQSTSCIRYHSFDDRPFPDDRTGGAQGDYDDIFTPAFDMTHIVSASGNVFLNFYTAGSATGSKADTLEVWASDDCGVKWGKLVQLSGTSVANNNISSKDFIPTSEGQWKAQTVAVPATYVTTKTFFKLRYKPASNGNNLYLDKFGISGYTTDVKEVANAETAFKIYPNPATNGCNIAFNTGNDGDVKYEIRDIAGKLIYSKTASYQPNTLVQEHIDRSLLATGGVYLVTLIEANTSNTQKLVVY